MASPPLRQRKRIRRLIAVSERAGIIGAGTVCVLAALVFVARLDGLQVSAIAVEGNNAVRSGDIVEHAADVLSGSYVFLPRQNSFIYPRSELRRSLLTQFPRLRDVSVERSDRTALTISLEERRAWALWCGPSPDAEGRCFFIDDAGFVFAPAPDFSSEVFFRYYGGSVSPADPLRSHVADPEWLKRFSELLDELEQFGMVPHSAYLQDQQVELSVRGGSLLFMRRYESPEEILSRLATVLYGSEYDLLSGSGPTFSYIDLRFRERVFYKLKEDEEESEALVSTE